jgi:hypothetical protein
MPPDPNNPGMLKADGICSTLMGFMVGKVNQCHARSGCPASGSEQVYHTAQLSV